MRGLLRFLFVIYCVEAGIFLVVVPWSLSWERLMHTMATPGLGELLLAPTSRGAIAGFGLVHLVWGTHDLLSWIKQRRSREDVRA